MNHRVCARGQTGQLGGGQWSALTNALLTNAAYWLYSTKHLCVCVRLIRAWASHLFPLCGCFAPRERERVSDAMSAQMVTMCFNHSCVYACVCVCLMQT